MDAASLARACADALSAADAPSQGLDIELISVAPGQAVLAMTVSEMMVNWHQTCHGGFIFLLADAAFGYASNTHNRRMVAQYCCISYLNPAKHGERLTARATERHLEGRSGIYDVAVTRADGTAIAEFRGHARAIAGNIVAEIK